MLVRHMTIVKKIIFGFVALLFLIALLIGLSRYSLSTTASKFTGLIENENVVVKHAFTAKIALLEARRIEKDLLYVGDETLLNSAKKFISQLRSELEIVDTIVKKTDDQKLIEVTPKLISLSSDYQKQFQAMDAAPVGQDRMMAAIALRKTANAMESMLQDFLANLNDRITKETEKTQSYIGYIGNFAMLAGIIAIIIGMVASILITRSLLKQMGGEPEFAAEIALKIAEGDLTVVIETKAGDQSSLLFAMKRMSESLTNIVAKVRSSTDSIGTAAQQVAAGNNDLSQRTAEQAASLEETASSMEELASTVRQNAENAKQANQLAVNASDVAVKGGQVVNEVVHTMASISTSSKKIVDIISVIDGIAFQTNILALNAAVEAARAGEQGRGFAVVAAEVRNLAQRSAAAAKEIKALIENSVNNVDIGAKQVDQAGLTMNEIVIAVKRVTDIMSEIAAASNEQSAGIEQVNEAITQMDDVTQQNAALVEEATAAAEAMREQASTLANAVGVFRLKDSKGSKQENASKLVATSQVASAVAPQKMERHLVMAKESSDSDWKEF
jgi:methyl-accepting chemotaxis protein